MITKKEFNELLKTREHWSGRQIGNVILQTWTESMNGKEPLIDDKTLSKIFDSMPNTSQNYNDYLTFTNIFSGMTDAYNFVDAQANEALTALWLLHSLIDHLSDWLYAEQNNQKKPVIISERQYKRYKEKYSALTHEFQQANKKKVQSFYSILGLEWITRIELFKGNEAKSLVEKYQQETIDIRGVRFLRKLVEKAKKQAHSSNLRLSEFFDDYSLDQKSFIKRNYGKESDSLEDAFMKFKKALKNRQQDLIVNTDLDNAQINKMLADEFPYEESEGYFPYIHDNISKFAFLHDHDYFWIRKFANTLRDKDADEFNKFFKRNFNDFIEARKKDLANQFPDLAKPLNKLSSDTNIIISGITYEALAKAKITGYKHLTSMSYAKDNCEFYQAFPKVSQQRVKTYGYSVHYDNATGNFTKKANVNPRLIKDGENWLASIQHYDIVPFVSDTLKKEAHKIVRSISAVNHYITNQQAYTDLFKGIAVFAEDKDLEEYHYTPAYKQVAEEIKKYNYNIVCLLAAINDSITDKKQKDDIRQLVKRSFPSIDTNKPRYSSPNPADIAKSLKDLYGRETPSSITDVLNQIKGAS